MLDLTPAERGIICLALKRRAEETWDRVEALRAKGKDQEADELWKDHVWLLRLINKVEAH